jgi:CheY-like chemotaxis protein
MTMKRTILIVDDDADDREIVKDAFTTTLQDGQDYVFIESGDKLLEYLEKQQASTLPSLILLDLNMPGKDGRETLKEIKSNNLLHTIPIVVFTTSSSVRDRTMSYELGANCFITKPDTFNKLADLTTAISKLWLQ